MLGLRTRIAMVSLVALGACDKPPDEQARGPQAPEIAVRDPGPAAAQPPPPPEPEPQPEPEPEPEPERTYGPADLTALTDPQRELLAAGEEDPPFPVEIHYVQSNESRHDLFFPYIDGVGGCAIGVGSDQTFTLAAKARASILFMMDIDRRVVDLHLMHRIFILEAETPEALWAFWDRENAATSKALLEDRLPEYGLDARTIRRTLQGYRVYRETVHRHLRRVLNRTRDGEAVTWLSNRTMYDHIRALYQTGRVRVMQGNLAGEHSMRTAATACAALGERMRVVYMSNAEEYFVYSPDFIANMQAQPIDERSVVLRTIYSKKWPHADLWAYQVQTLEDFKARLSDRRNRKRSAMLRYIQRDGGMERESLGIVGFSRIGYEGDADAP